MSYMDFPVIAEWLTASKNDPPGILSVPTRAHYEKLSTTYYREKDAYHIYYQKVTKVIGGEPRIEWIFKMSMDQERWDKAVKVLHDRPEANAKFLFELPA